MSVYLKIDNCLECPCMKRKGFFDTSNHCQKVKQELPYVTKYVPGAGRTPGAHIKTPTGVIPDWCPLAKELEASYSASSEEHY